MVRAYESKHTDVNKQESNNFFSVKGEVAIVTGGAGRLGTQFCVALHDAGAKVVSFDVAESEKLNGLAEQMNVDITGREAVFKAVRKVAEQYGKVSILINNAAFRISRKDAKVGDEGWGPHETYPEELWKKEFDVGLNGAMWCTQAAAEQMIKARRGSIVNIASTSAITAPDHRKYEKGRFKSAAYPVIKTALLGFTRGWASYFASAAPGVRVNAVCFGAVNFGSTEPEFLKKLGERNMLGRPARPDEYGGIIVFLCSPAATFINASTLVADGGQTAW